MGNKKRYDCESCVNFTPIGEGDHICCEHPDILLMDGYARTKDYLYCKGKDYECRWGPPQRDKWCLEYGL